MNKEVIVTLQQLARYWCIIGLVFSQLMQLFGSPSREVLAWGIHLVDQYLITFIHKEVFLNCEEQGQYIVGIGE